MSPLPGCDLAEIGMPGHNRDVWLSLWFHNVTDSVCVITVTARRGRQKFCTAGIGRKMSCMSPGAYIQT